MIKLATPVSHLFEDPAQAERICRASHCLEGRLRYAGCDLPGQEIFHFSLTLVHPWDDDTRQMVGAAIKARPGLRLASFHLSTRVTQPQIKNHMYHPGSGQVLSREELLDHGSQNINWLRGVMGPDALIAVENCNYYPTGAYEHVTEGDFITDLVEGNDLRFLLDVSHARITAHNRSLDPEAYLASLPLKAAVQVHLARHALGPDGLAHDRHHCPQPADLRQALDYVRPGGDFYLTVEYYQDIDRLLDCLGALRELLPPPGKTGPKAK